ncbi:MAG: MFS transporter [Proteobacteria bacterium]|nr:MFS transporter [Pseudomonadota bacterium]
MPAVRAFPARLPTMNQTPLSATPAERYTAYTSRQRWTYLALLFLVSTSNFLDRNILSVVLPPIKQEFGVSDTLLGLLGGASFAILYAVLGIPVARWADRGNRPLIITLALCAWSAMTALCGAAQTFWQLALARVGVGIGEAGALPPCQSLLADYFPLRQRSLALAILSAASTAGTLIGFVGGGWAVVNLGWRWTFALAGLPGMVIAALSWALLPEPRHAAGRLARTDPQESFLASLRLLWMKPTYRAALIGLTLWSAFSYGSSVFFPSYLVRTLGLTMTTVGTQYGAVAAVATLLGTLAGGWWADRAARRDPRALLRLPGIWALLSSPFYVLAFVVHDFSFFLVVAAIAITLLSAALPVVLAAAHAVCGSARRAMAVAILFFFMALVGGTIGPLLTGMISDALSPRFGPAGLGYALALMTLSIPAMGVLLLRASGNLADDAEA